MTSNLEAIASNLIVLCFLTLKSGTAVENAVYLPSYAYVDVDPPKKKYVGTPFTATYYVTPAFPGHRCSGDETSQTLHGTGIYAYMDPPKPPQLIGIYGSPMECLGIQTHGHTTHTPN